MDREQSEKHSRVELRVAGAQRWVLGKVAMMCRGCKIARLWEK
jgi:hypothetical protein